MKVLFLIILEDKPPPSNFSLKSLPEVRIDVVARIILSIFPKFTSYIEPTLHVVFAKENPTLLEVTSVTKIDSDFDEVSVAAEIRDLINYFYANHKQIQKQHFQANWKSIKDFEKYLKNRIIDHREAFYLHETGKNINEEISKENLGESYVFILGGRHDISEKHENIITKLDIPKLNLGEKSYLASTCTTKVLYHLEKLHL
ncbi:MAG: hypothetical protein FK733_16575 [Asgard group archaeon]|nr:hypothetical protein [Asgard group archaeon]